MMLKRFTIVLFIFINFISYGQLESDTKYWIDINGKSISKELFTADWKNRDSEFAYWSYIAKDSGRVVKTHYKFNLYAVNHPYILNYINRITNKKLGENTILLIDFFYQDEVCEGQHTNKWNWGKIQDRKDFFTNISKTVVESKNKNLVYLVFFEKGILLKNSKSKNEYFFSDVDDILRKNIFLNPSTCGSTMLSKPDGKTLVRNGDRSAENMAANLNPKIWDNLPFE